MTGQKVQRLPIVNFDMYCEKKKVQRKHSDLLPNHVRCIMCGPSGSGKTNVLLSLIFDADGLRFQNIYVFSKSLYQPKYKFLEKVLSSLDDIGYYPFTENEQVPHPNDVERHSIMVFDDVACEKQDNIRNYFTMGRHNNVDAFYLCQTYSRCPKQLIRDNVNLIVLFKQDETNLKHIYNDHVNTDMTYEKFKNICIDTWKHGAYKFVVIDKESDINNGRYRRSFGDFIKESEI